MTSLSYRRPSVALGTCVLRDTNLREGLQLRAVMTCDLFIKVIKFPSKALVASCSTDRTWGIYEA